MQEEGGRRNNTKDGQKATRNHTINYLSKQNKINKSTYSVIRYINMHMEF